LCDDLNTHTAIVRLNELAGAGDFATLRASLRFLGFSCDSSKLARRVSVTVSISGTSTVAAVGSVSVSTSDSDSATTEARSQSEPARRFTLNSEAAHFSITPGSAGMFVVRGDGTIETDPSTQRFIDDRIARRNAARAAKNFAEADKIRDELSSIGVAIKDNKDGATTWELKR
jgi:cysteinyl-tRNA synthetase